MKDIVIIYHKDCQDGFSGAWAAWKKFGRRADYIGALHHQSPPAGLKNKTLYFIDFVYSEADMRQLIKHNQKVVVIDHHITAKKTAQLAHEHYFALNHSGAVLAWRYFHPQKSIPRFLRHVEDVDIWRWKLSHTKEILAYAQLLEFNFANWNKIVKAVESPQQRKKIIEYGKVISIYEKRIIDRLITKAELVKFEGHKALAVNSPILNSEIGNELVKKLPPIGIVWSRKEGRYAISLRSNGKADVAKLAQRFGGGGHKAAAGFSLSGQKLLPWKILKS